MLKSIKYIKLEFTELDQMSISMRTIIIYKVMGRVIAAFKEELL
jgi:hypothetical protein